MKLLKLISYISIVIALVSCKNTNDTKDSSNDICNKESYEEGFKMGDAVFQLYFKETCEQFVTTYNTSSGKDKYKASKCFCEGYNDGKNGLISKYTLKEITNQSNEITQKTSGEEEYEYEGDYEEDQSIQSDIKSDAPNYQANQNEEYKTYSNYIVMGSVDDPAFFHDSPDYSQRRKGRFTTEETVFVQQIVNGFAYIEFTNSDNKTSKGWIEVSYLR